MPCAREARGNVLAQKDPGDRALWLVYLVRCADNTLYCGTTTDLARRLAQHNGERAGGARYTATRRPVELVATASCSSRSEALRLEARIKKAPRQRKRALLAAWPLPPSGPSPLPEP